MFVEDIIQDFAKRINIERDPLGHLLAHDDWTRKFITSLNGSVTSGRALSTKQGQVFLDVVKKLKKSLGGPVGGYNEALLDQFLASPRYRMPPYQSTPMRKEVRYLGDNKLGFRCKREDDIMSDIKNLGNRGRENSWKTNHKPVFNRQYRLWVISVNKDTLPAVMRLISQHSFDYDDAVAEYLTLAENSKLQPSTFVLDEVSGKIIANITDNPIIESWVKNVLYGEIL